MVNLAMLFSYFFRFNSIGNDKIVPMMISYATQKRIMITTIRREAPITVMPQHEQNPNKTSYRGTITNLFVIRLETLMIVFRWFLSISQPKTTVLQ